MRFDITRERNSFCMSWMAALLLRSALVLITLILAISLAAQKPSSASEPHEMLMTEQGFLAISTPRGWVRTAGPGLAYFVPKAGNGQARAWIYISSAPIGAKEEAKDMKAYIESDIASFKDRFKAGIVQREEPLNLPNVKLQAPVYSFRSGEKNNVVEQVVYVGESNRVLTFVLSAKDKLAFDKALSSFQEFAKSYAGSITVTPTPN